MATPDADGVIDLAARILRHKFNKENSTLFRSRFNRYNPSYPEERAIDDILQGEDVRVAKLAELLIELGRRGGADAALSGLEWVKRTLGPPREKRIYDAVLVACRNHYKWEKALEVFEGMKGANIEPDIYTYNLVIAACSNAGKTQEAFKLFQDMAEANVKPNTFTVQMLIQGCNFKKRGDFEPAIFAYHKVSECKSATPPPGAMKDVLFDVCIAGMRKAKRWQDAMKVFVELHKLEIEDDSRIFNALLYACARDRKHKKAFDVFAHMRNIGVQANTATYNSLIEACVRDGQVIKALQVFEWMVEGRGAPGPVAANLETYNTLLRACHQKAMLEKALEVMSWMINSGLELDAESFDELSHTVEIAQLWDEKAIKPAVKGISEVTPDRLRPSPFDGMRMLYTEGVEELLEDRLLSLEKIGRDTWAPVSMRPSPIENSTLGDIKSSLKALPWPGLSKRVKAYRPDNVSPLVKSPNALHWKKTGYSMKGALHWDKAPPTGRQT